MTENNVTVYRDKKGKVVAFELGPRKETPPKPEPAPILLTV